MNDLLQQMLYIGEGIFLTLPLLFGSLLIGFSLGLFISISQFNGYGKYLSGSFVSIMRGTPLILQLAFVYFSLPQLLHIKLSVLEAGLVAFGLNSAAYFSEIFRAGIHSVPLGQFQASQTLEISRLSMWKDIILPQVFRRTLPALLNESIAILKETSLISSLGGMDLMRRSETLAAQQFVYFTPLCLAAIYYYTLTLLIEKLGKLIERKKSYAEAL